MRKPAPGQVSPRRKVWNSVCTASVPVRYEISRQASSKIDEIIRYTDRYFGHAQAEEYVAGLFYSFDLLCDNPKLGRAWDREKRCYIYRAHYVFYRISEECIPITDIRNTRQNLPSE